MFMSTAVQLVLVPTLYVRTPFWLKLVITLVFFSQPTLPVNDCRGGCSC